MDQNGFESSDHGLQKGDIDSKLNEVLAQLKYQILPTLKDIKETDLKEIKETEKKTEEHLDKLNGTVATCLTDHAVLAERVDHIEEKGDDTAKKQIKSDDRLTKIIAIFGSLLIAALLAALFDLLSKVKIV